MNATPNTSIDETTREVLRHLSQAVAGGSDDIFHELIRCAAQTLHTDYAFIGEMLPDQPDHARMIAFYKRGAFAPGFVYELADTPCRDVVNQTYRFYPRDIQQMFADPHLKEIEAESYAAIPLFDSNGLAIGLMGVIDRTALHDNALTEAVLRILSVRAAAELERRYAVAAHRRSEISFRSLFESTEEAVFVHDIASGAIVDANRTACERYGYPRDEMLCLSIDDLSSGVAPYTQQHAIKHLERAIAGEPVTLEWHARNKDGSLRWDEVRIKRTTIGGVERLLVFTRDITDRKEREVALRKSEDRLRATIEAALDCVVVIDAQGRIMEFNPAAEACFGHKKFDILGRPLADLVIPPRYRDELRAGIEKHLHNGDSPFLGRRVEITAMRSDGSEFPAELAVTSAQGADGNIFIGYLRDITETKRAETERERLESQLRQSQKMQAIGQLTGGIAHDFNNILTGVMGYIVMAQERTAIIRDAQTEKYLARAQRAVQRARDLIQQMLTFSRGQRGAPRALDLAPLVRESVKLLESSLPSTIEIHTAFADNLPQVRLDPVQLEQVLMNLCINARDAMEGYGVIDISLRSHDCPDCICASCRKAFQGRHVVLTVTDSGAGISPENFDRIFEPFFTTKEIGKGSGMGLAMVHGIVHEHGGHLLVESRPGEGTRFHVVLPLMTTQDARIDAATAPAHGDGHIQLHGRVLLVDDDATAREFMEDRLTSWGIDVTCFDNGERALDDFQSNAQHYHAAILDQTMPRMTGIDLARRLALLRPDLPILLYTGYGDANLEEQIKGAGIHALLKKPIAEHELLALLRQIL